MTSKDLKNNILQKIGQIEDETLLQYIQDFLDASDKYYTKKNKRFEFTDDNQNNDTVDFTDYIKEWLKDM